MRMELKGWVIPTAVGVTSFAVGAGVGYFFARYRHKSVDISNLCTKEDSESLKGDIESLGVQLSFMFEERDCKADVKIQQAARVVRDLKEISPDVEASIAALRDLYPSVGLRVDKEEEVASVFRLVDEDWNYDEEVPKRGPEVPYILHRDEFFADEKGYDNQTTLTYYQGDDVLCDENDVPIYNPERAVGKLIFGHGSGDPNVVYVRNEKLEAEYEVLLDQGHYVVEVLGGQVGDALEKPDLKHSVYKFRPE